MMMNNLQTFELLRFVVPNPPVFTVTLPVSENPVTQRYEYDAASPETIVMCETNGDGSAFQYTFGLEAQELIVESSTEITASGHQIEHPAGYTYLRLPLSEDIPEEWEYRLSNDIRVACIARLMQQPIDGKLYEKIHFSRLFHYSQRKKGKPDMIVEQYVADHGMMHKLVLSGLKL